MKGEENFVDKSITQFHGLELEAAAGGNGTQYQFKETETSITAGG